MTDYPGLNDDFVDLLEALQQEQVEFLIVGAHAMAVHGVPRATGDLDIFVRPTPENARRVLAALGRFGAPVEAHGVRQGDFATPDTVYQMGLPPRRIDVLTSISGVTFDEAWSDRVRVQLEGRDLDFIGPNALLANKKAAGRDKDVADAKLLAAKLGRS